jgi:hypothetical protein
MPLTRAALEVLATLQVQALNLLGEGWVCDIEHQDDVYRICENMQYLIDDLTRENNHVIEEGHKMTNGELIAALQKYPPDVLVNCISMINGRICYVREVTKLGDDLGLFISSDEVLEDKGLG